MRYSHQTFATAFVILLAATGARSSQAQYVLRTIDVPGAASTYLQSNNDAAAIVGCDDVAGFASDNVSFLLIQGVVIPFGYPGSQSTCAVGNSNSGEITGSFLDQSGVRHGFSLCGKSHTTIDYPGAVFTVASVANMSGIVVGYYYDGSAFHGFELQGGVFSNIDPPGAVSSIAGAINDSGQVAGIYTLASGATQGYLLSSGIFTPIDFPGAASINALSLNGSGQIVGIYTDGSGVRHGFTDFGGVFSSFDYPGAASTELYSINDSGQLVGDWFGPLGYPDGHGFLATPVNGPNGPTSGSAPMCAIPQNALEPSDDDAGLPGPGHAAEPAAQHRKRRGH